MLALLNSSDQDRFSSFLLSPYFNSSKTLILFWEQWRNRVLSASGDISEEEFIAGTPLLVSRIDALCWELMRKLRKFIGLQEYEQSPELEVVTYGKALLEKGAEIGILKRVFAQLDRELEVQPESPEKYLALFYHKAHSRQARILARTTESDWSKEFAELNVSLQQFSKVKNLQMGCGAANASQIFYQKGNRETKEPTFYSQYVHAKEDEKETLLERFYRLILSLLVGVNSSDLFPQLLDLLESQRDQISESIRNDGFSYILNYCIRQINLGNEPFLKHTFDLYRLLIRNGDLLPNGQISPQQFKNLVSLGCRLNRLEWAETFIEEYHSCVSGAEKEQALNYNKAVLRFHQAEYRDSIQAFKKVIQWSADDVFYGLDARIYLWKSYFEYFDSLSAEEVDEMFKLYDAFRLYIDRNEKVSPLHQVQYRNFLRLFKHFMKCLEKPIGSKRKQALQRFQNKLDEVNGVANKTWFSLKVEEALGRS